MHNGSLKSLKEVVHFYNTSQALPRCAQGSPGDKVTCWPPPEYPATLNTTQLGNLGLTSDEEDDIVAFLKTLTDGFVTSPSTLAKPTLPTWKPIALNIGRPTPGSLPEPMSRMALLLYVELGHGACGYRCCRRIR
jgi:hypothetical protein